MADRPQSKAKFRRLVKFLDVDEAMVRGLLQLMWDHAEDKGDPVFRNAERVADACWWDGDPGVLVEGLLQERWIDELEDGTYVIHDWWDSIPYPAKKKANAIKYALINGLEIPPGILKWAVRNMPTVREAMEEPGKAVKKAEKKPKPAEKEKPELPKPNEYPPEFELFWPKYVRACKESGSAWGDKKRAAKHWITFHRKRTADELWNHLQAQIADGLWGKNRDGSHGKLRHAENWLNPKSRGNNCATEVEPVSKLDDPGYMEWQKLSNEMKNVQLSYALDGTYEETFNEAMPWWVEEAVERHNKAKEDNNGGSEK